MTKPSPRPQLTLALACGVFLGAGIVLASLGPALPFLAAQTGQSLVDLGWIFTALSAGVVLAQFVVGPGGDALGLRTVLAVSMALMGGATLGVSFGQQLLALLFWAMLAGVGFGGVLAAGNVLVARLFARRSAAALNGVNVFYGVGSMIGPAVVGLAGSRLGLPLAALWLGAALLLVLAPLTFWFAARLPRVVSVATTAGEDGARTRTLLLLGLLLLVYTGTEVSLGGWVTVYMMKSAAFAPTSAALVASGFWLALTIGRIVGALLGLRVAPWTLLLASLLGLVGGALLLATGIGVGGRTLAGVLLLGFACGPVFPTVLAVLTTAAHGSSRAAGMALALGNGGGLVLPALIGLLLNRYGPAAMAGLILASTIVMLGLYVAATAGSVRTAPPIREKNA